MKRILVPTDFSDCAKKAESVAISIAKKSGAELYFIHIEEVTPEVVHIISRSKTTSDKHQTGHARFELQQSVEFALHHDVIAHPIFVPTTKDESILDYLEPFKIDWLVMGSHGARGIRELTLGSKTQKIIREVKIPTLVVKGATSDFKPTKIVFASTFREDMSNYLKAVVDFARLYQAKIHLVFLNLLYHLIDEQEAMRIMKSQIQPLNFTDYTLSISETNDEEWGIISMANMIDADLISLVMDKHTGLESLFKSSVAEKLINHADIPVLIINHN